MTMFFSLSQTVIDAMSTLDPPIEITNPESLERAKYITDVVAKPSFIDFTPVSCKTCRG